MWENLRQPPLLKWEVKQSMHEKVILITGLTVLSSSSSSISIQAFKMLILLLWPMQWNYPVTSHTWQSQDGGTLAPKAITNILLSLKWLDLSCLLYIYFFITVEISLLHLTDCFISSYKLLAAVSFLSSLSSVASISVLYSTYSFLS